MITLNDYLYSGDTVLKILHNYSAALRNEASCTHNQIDIAHSNFLLHMTELLEHNDFLSSQSKRIRELYKYMAREYHFLSFTFKGRIKSLIRAEEKFNGRLVSSVNEYYKTNHAIPAFSDIRDELLFHDLIAYRIVISLPKCHVNADSDKQKQEIQFLYKIAEVIPDFMEGQGFTIGLSHEKISSRLSKNVRPYYKDFIEYPTDFGYRSLHITLFDNASRSYCEVQLRTKEMDDLAEIGLANHLAYEKRQEEERRETADIPVGECSWYDEARERIELLQNLDLSKLDVDMFAAINNILINDGCGLYRGRQITPFEHLSRFQNDII